MAEQVCSLDELSDPGTREHEFSDGRAVFIVRRGERVFAYENRCPHTGVTLNWMPDRFLDRDGAHVQCDMHGALFRIDDGSCVFGPCAGQALTPVPVAVAGGNVVLGEGEA